MKRKRTQAFLIGAATLGPAALSAQTLYQSCYGCHGPGGVSHSEHMPSIAGINFRYFYATMQAFKKDRRKATVMDRIAKGYKTSQLQMMALYFGAQPWTGQRQAVDASLAARGAELHQEYCEKCHADNGYFQDRETPPLAGQARGYLLEQMRDYRETSPLLPQPALMQERLEKLTDADLEALSAFYASGPRPDAADKTD